MIPVVLASALVEFAPMAARWLGGARAGEAADAVVEIARGVTGLRDGDAALEAIKADKTLAFQFRHAVMENQAELDKLYIVDMQNARARDVELAKVTGHSNWRANGMLGIATIFVLVILGVLIWGTELDEFAKATVSIICGRATGWIDQAFQFEFGTNRSNKTKDDTINNLSR